MPNNIQWRVTVDFDRDEEFWMNSKHYQGDISTYVRSFNFNVGFTNHEQYVAAPTKCTIVLENDSGAFDPHDTSALYYGRLKAGLLVAIAHRKTTDNTYAIHYYGIIRDIRYVLDPHSVNRTVTITLSDWTRDIMEAEYSPTLLTNTATNDAMDALFTNMISVPMPYASAWALLDYSVLESGSGSYNRPQLYGIESSVNPFYDSATLVSGRVLAYIGDNTGTKEGASAGGYIRELVAAEAGGFFYYSGIAHTFVTREWYNYVLQNLTAFEFTSEDLVKVDPRYGDDLYNDLTVTYEPRSVGAAGSVIYRHDADNFSLSAGQSRRVQARYHDADNPEARVGATFVIPPLATTDYTANAASDGSGADRTDDLSVVADGGAQSATLVVTNMGSSTLYVTMLQLRGTPLTSFGKQSVNAVDVPSVASYGRVSKTIHMGIESNAGSAEDYCNLQVGLHATPYLRYNTITVYVDIDTRAALFAKIMAQPIIMRTYVRVNDTATGHDRVYLIWGYRYSYSQATKVLECVFTLKPLLGAASGQLDSTRFGQLDSTAILDF